MRYKLTPAGERNLYVTLSEPGPAVPDSDGGYTQTSVWLQPPTAYASIRDTTASERAAAGTVIATATHVITLPYHPGVTHKTVIGFNGRTFRVTEAKNPELANRETVCSAVEVVT